MRSITYTNILMKRLLFLTVVLCIGSIPLAAQMTVTSRFVIRDTGIDQVCATFNNYKAAYMVECEYPMGDEAVASVVRQWINEQSDYWNKELYSGDMLNPMNLFKHYMAHFAEENTAQKIEQHLLKTADDASDIGWSEADEPEWYYKARITNRYITPNVISYSYSRMINFVGTAACKAYTDNASFNRQTGERLSWQIFTSQEEVRRMAIEALKAKYDDLAQFFPDGTPDPSEPLLLADGVEFGFGGSIVSAPRYYDEDGMETVYTPFVLVGYEQLQSVMTAEARQLLKQ